MTVEIWVFVNGKKISGLNIVSEFNLENVTKYGSESLPEDLGTNAMEEIVPETSYV